MRAENRHPGSFRDPTATVFEINGKILRGLTAEGATRYSDVKKTGLLSELEQQGQIVITKDFDTTNVDSTYVNFLEHELIPFVSYPYEWPFALLKEAALLHLSIQIKALERNVVLSDASAYNIQFRGVTPVFIDILSFRTYKEGELWGGHRQFCEQFLNPLLLQAKKDISYQAWYRGNLEGIPTEWLANLLSLRDWFSIRMLVHVLLPARSQQVTQNKKQKALKTIQQSVIPKSVYKSFLMQLYRWIENLQPKKTKLTTWENYSITRTYNSKEFLLKKDFVAEFVSANQTNVLWDLGCNDGEFSELALQSGAKRVVGFDADLGALEKAFHRAKINQLNFLPLYQHITNPSPQQGWLLNERTSIITRGTPDAIIALAFIHHLAIAHNIPLPEVVSWLVSLAPTGIIEFVQKSDPTVQAMLMLKGDIFPDYTEDFFIKLLSEKATIVKTCLISQTGRRLFWYKRHT